MKNKKGKWIVITGMDGTGKTTLRDSIAKEYNAFSFKLPYHSFVCEYLDISGLPGKDRYTDMCLFLADHRITDYKIKSWIKKYKFIVSQRAFHDLFIFNKICGYNYKFTYDLLKPDNFEKPSISFYLVAKSNIAYNKIKNDPYADKYETPSFIKSQYNEVINFYNSINKDKLLKKLFSEPRYLIDTTNLTKKETYDQIIKILKKHKI